MKGKLSAIYKGGCTKSKKKTHPSTLSLPIILILILSLSTYIRIHNWSTKTKTFGWLGKDMNSDLWPYFARILEMQVRRVDDVFDRPLFRELFEESFLIDFNGARWHLTT